MGRKNKEDLIQLYEKIKSLPYVQEILEALPYVALIINAQRQIIFINETFMSILGLEDPCDAMGMRPGEIFNCIHAGTRPTGCGTSESCQFCGALSAVLESQKTGLKITKDSRITVSKDGESISFDLRVTANPLKMAEEDLTIVTFMDISHEKRREVLERIFFHDLLNTAGNIFSLSQMIERFGEAKRKNYLKILHGTSLQLVEEIKAHKILIGAEKGDLEVNVDTIHSDQLLENIVPGFNDLLESRKVHVQINACTASFESDPILLARVLVNMLKNAIEASAQSGTVTVGCIEMEDGIKFWTHNQGHMEPSIKMQVFQRSFSTKGTGRGIGTYSIKLLTEKYLQGKAGFTSTESEGTTFFVILPPKIKENS